MSKAYVVCEVGFEYNDEVYYRPEGEGLDPKSVFLNADDANALCLQKNLEWFKSQENDTWSRGLIAYTDDGLDGICDRNQRVSAQKIRDLLSKYDSQVFSETWEDGDRVEDEQILERFYSYLALMPKEEQLEVIGLLRVFGWTVKEVDFVQ